MNLLKIENAVYRPWHVSPCYTQMQWVLEVSVQPDGSKLYIHSPSKSELEGWVAKRNAEKIAAQKRHDDDLTLRQDVVDELVASGKAMHVALNLTNTLPKLLEQARLVGVL